jgi:hypothetical protein
VVDDVSAQCLLELDFDAMRIAITLLVSPEADSLRKFEYWLATKHLEAPFRQGGSVAQIKSQRWDGDEDPPPPPDDAPPAVAAAAVFPFLLCCVVVLVSKP